jgi:hypothetical protein
MPSLASTSGAASETAISSQSSSGNRHAATRKLSRGAIAGIGVGVGALTVSAIIAIVLLFHRYRKRKGSQSVPHGERDKTLYTSVPRGSPTPGIENLGHSQYAELGGEIVTRSQGPEKKPNLVDPAELPGEGHAASAELWSDHPSTPIELDAGAPSRPRFDGSQHPQSP